MVEDNSFTVASDGAGGTIGRVPGLGGHDRETSHRFVCVRVDGESEEAMVAAAECRSDGGAVAF